MTKKIILSIFLIFFSIELISFLYYSQYHKESIGFLIKTPEKKKNCDQFLFDFGLESIHNDKYKCDKIDGVHKENLVFYNNKNGDDNIILTLGGSTTDGYSHTKKDDGNEYIVWPYFLNNNCNKISNCKIINGGSSAFKARDERVKLIRTILTSDKLPKVVISLSGINDIKGYQRDMELKFPYQPFNTTYLLFEKKNINKKITFFPGILRFLTSILNNFIDDKYFNPEKRILKSKLFEDYNYSLPKNEKNDYGDLWVKNIKISYSVAKEFNIKYLVFLQPTLGLENYKENEISEFDLKLLKNISDKNYLTDLNASYKKLKKYCSSLEYCYDISDIFSGVKKRLYYDFRHPNKEGNEIIANKIFDTLKDLNYIK
mgnify:CR=1 FL=1